jgi:ubiquinone/menaquinone biosynthesis C-methylase UbiE
VASEGERRLDPRSDEALVIHVIGNATERLADRAIGRHGLDEDQRERIQVDRRAQLLEGLTGRVLEIGAGNGLNFRHYPASVEEVVAVEPERHLRGLAVDAASDSAVPVAVVDALAEQLLYADASFDAAVASLTLCSIADVERALAELHRVVRPYGELRFFEHVASPRRAARALQRAADADLPKTHMLGVARRVQPGSRAAA